MSKEMDGEIRELRKFGLLDQRGCREEYIDFKADAPYQKLRIIL